MPNKTDIEWTDFSSNPLKLQLHQTGTKVNFCVLCSKGCANCYSAGNTRRFWPKAEGPFPGYSPKLLTMGTPVLNDIEIQRMLTFKPRGPFKHGAERPKVFVGDMTDLFGPWVPFDLLDRLFAVFALRPDVDWQILTKRPGRMREYLAGDEHGPAKDGSTRRRIVLRMHERNAPPAPQGWRDASAAVHYGRAWPLPNVMLGTSVENQPMADERIPELLRVPAAVRFLSMEPLLGAIDLNRSIGGTRWIGGQRGCGATHRGDGSPGCPREPHHHHDERCNPGIDWVIVGSESGPKRREMKTEWAENIAAQCRAAGVAFFMKQMVVDGKVSGELEAFPPALQVREFPGMPQPKLPEVSHV